MIRAAILFLQITLLVFAGVWLANEPGTVTVIWRDWRIDPPIGVLVVIVVLLALASAVVYRIWRFVRQAPTQILSSHRLSRERKGYRELSQGMIALAAGDAAGALRHARRADSLLGEPTAGHLLIAQAATLQGKQELAKKHFEAMQDEGDAGIARLRGLFDQAIESKNSAEALVLGTKIRELKSDSAWILPQLFKLQVSALDWISADRSMADIIKFQVMPADKGKRYRALVLYERGRSALDLGDSVAALGFMRESHDLDPLLIASSVEYARLLNSNGKKRRALRVLEQTWAQTCHPTVAHEFAKLAPSNPSEVESFKAIQKLTSAEAGGTEGALLLAEYALDAQLWGEARKNLNAVIPGHPSAVAYSLLARLEEVENEAGELADQYREAARIAKAAKSWRCDECGSVSNVWATSCANCNAFGSLEWTEPAVEAAAPQVEYSGAVPLLESAASSEERAN